MKRPEHGSALVELTWLGLLLLIPLVYVVLSVVAVERAAYGATAAARSAARAYVLAADPATARARAVDAARLAMRDQGLALDASQVVIVCGPTPESCLQPGSTVEVRLDLQVLLPVAPTLFGRQAAGITVDASHTEVYGSYREASS